MILGVDIGNITTICVGEEKEFIVESRVKEFQNINEFGEKDIVEFDNKKLLFGDGYFENNLLKHEKENFLDLLYYAIANTCNDNSVKIVLGVPAGQYNSEKDEIKKIVEKNNCRSLKINGELRTITIEDVMIAPEGYGVKVENLTNLNNKAKTLIVDIGGGTSDVAEFDENGKFIGGKSIKTGLLDLYKDIQETLDTEYRLNVSLEDARKYFDGELVVRNNKFEEETEYKKENLLKFVKFLLNELRGLYKNIAQYNIILSGGGAKKVYPAFVKVYNQTKAIEDIKSNAKGFRKVGVAKWQKN